MWGTPKFLFSVPETWATLRGRRSHDSKNREAWGSRSLAGPTDGPITPQNLECKGKSPESGSGPLWENVGWLLGHAVQDVGQFLFCSLTFVDGLLGFV